MKKFLILFILFATTLSSQVHRRAGSYYQIDTTPTAMVPADTFPQYIDQYEQVLMYAAEQGIALPSDTVQNEQNRLMVELVATGVYDSLKTAPKSMLHIWLGDSSTVLAFMSINWLNPYKYYASEIGTVNWHPYNGINSSSNNSYLDPNFEIYTHDTTWLYKNISMGAYNVGGNLSVGGGKQMGAASRSGGTRDQYLNIWRGYFGGKPNLWAAISGTLAQSRESGQIFNAKDPNLPAFTSIHRTTLDSAELVDKVINSFILPPPFVDPGYVLWENIISNKGYATLVSDFDFIIESSVNADDFSNRSSRYMKLGILAELTANYDSPSDTINPTSITSGAYSKDTIIFSYIGGSVWDKMREFNYALTRYKEYFRKHNEKTVEQEILAHLYLPTDYSTDSNALPLLPRRVNKYGLDFQLPRAYPDSFKIWTVTNTNMLGAGSFLAAIDSAEGNGFYDFIVFEAGGLIDTTYYIERKINEEKGLMIFGQTAPSPGIRLHGLGIRTDKNTKMITFQHLRLGAGTDTLPGVARDSVTSPSSGWTQYSERDALAFNGEYQIIDHCTLNFGTDETVSSSARDFTFSNNLITKPAGYKYHNKGAHMKGIALYKQGNGQGQTVALYRNVFFGTSDRNPEMSNEMTGVLRENYVSNAFERGASFVASIEHDDSLTGFPILDASYNYYRNVNSPVFRFFSSGNLEREAETGPSSAGFGSKMMYVKNNIIDGITYADAWDDGCVETTNNVFTFNYVPSGCLPGDSITRDSIMRDVPLYTLPYWDTLPKNLAEPFLMKYAGARPQDKDTLEKEVFIEMVNQTKTIYPFDETDYLPILKLMANTQRVINSPINPLEIDSTGYMWIERYADSLHWKVTYPSNIPYPGIKAKTGAFLYNIENRFIMPNNNLIYKENC